MLGVRGRRARAERGPDDQRAARRAAVLATPELLDWTDGCLYAIGRSVSELRKGNEPDSYGDNALNEARVLVALLEEFKSRQEAKHPRASVA